MAAGVLPFAAMVSSAASTTAEIYGALAKAIDVSAWVGVGPHA